LTSLENKKVEKARVLKMSKEKKLRFAEGNERWGLEKKFASN
jgi:hypothetical protein